MNTTKVIYVLAMAAVTALASTACQVSPLPVPPVAVASCPAIDSRNWTAYVEHAPTGATSTLHVQGEVDLPTPGYQVTLRLGRADRSAIPLQQLILEATAPGGIVTQVVHTEAVSYQGPAIASQYRGVHVLCGGRVIAQIAAVPSQSPQSEPRAMLLECAGAITAQAGVDPLADPSLGTPQENAYFTVLALMDKEPGLKGLAGRKAASAARDAWLERDSAQRAARASECMARFGG